MRTHYSKNAETRLGTIVKRQREAEPSHCWNVPEEFRIADKNLYEAIRAIPDYTTPCHADPNAWQTRTIKEGNAERGRPRNVPKLSPFALRVRNAAAACSGCRVLTECTALLHTIDTESELPIATGVIAGYLVDPLGDRTREMLGMVKP